MTKEELEGTVFYGDEIQSVRYHLDDIMESIRFHLADLERRLTLADHEKAKREDYILQDYDLVPVLPGGMVPRDLPLEVVKKRALEIRGVVCDGCHGKNTKNTSDGSAKLKQCARCRSYWYCSPECQKAAWKAGHKNFAGFLITLKEATW
ncbi:hypothetical protein HDU76_009266 [Blyttiomyces sp. JEL0837]|nr:hypothetical protein HDU76_009266 [Blyttiomyces sp. JEL0837]